MLKISIPGYRDFVFENVVFDYNGTLAVGGRLSAAVKEMMPAVKEKLNVYILTSDTFGTVADECAGLGVQIKVIDGAHACAAKSRFVRELGAKKTICIGNGSNDAKMFKACALSILIIGGEGCSSKAMAQADIVVSSIGDALNLLIDPVRIVATLRG